MKPIITHSDLRAHLAKQIEGLANGTVTPKQAEAVTRIAHEITDNARSEMKIIAAQIQLRGANSSVGNDIANFGDTPLGGRNNGTN